MNPRGFFDFRRVFFSFSIALFLRLASFPRLVLRGAIMSRCSGWTSCRRTSRLRVPFSGWASFSVVAPSDALPRFQVGPPFPLSHSATPCSVSGLSLPFSLVAPSDAMPRFQVGPPSLATLRRLITLRAISCTVPPRLCLLSPRSSGLSPSERFHATPSWASRSMSGVVIIIIALAFLFCTAAFDGFGKKMQAVSQIPPLKMPVPGCFRFARRCAAVRKKCQPFCIVRPMLVPVPRRPRFKRPAS